jgi:beta-lactam-binding protein with PASTA domain
LSLMGNEGVGSQSKRSWSGIGTAIAAILGVLALLGWFGLVRAVPDVYGQTEPDGYSRLVAYDFNVREVYQENSRVPAGKVARTDPAGNANVLRNWTVTMYLSTGPHPTGVQPTPPSLPDVYNLTQEAALQQLKAAGYTKTVIYPVCSSSVAAGHVRQVILAGRTPEIALVDRQGPTNAAGGVTTDQQVAIKVSTGVPC